MLDALQLQSLLAFVLHMQLLGSLGLGHPNITLGLSCMDLALRRETVANILPVWSFLVDVTKSILGRL